MNKLRTSLAFLFSIFLITSCSYKPIFSQKNYNIKLDELFLSGDKDVNRIIESQLSLFKSVEKDELKNKPSANDDAKTYSININSTLSTVIISKDSKGDPQKFEKIVIVSYKVIDSRKTILDNEIVRKYLYNNETDKFKLEQTEEIIVENLASNITEAIISSIINIDDN